MPGDVPSAVPHLFPHPRTLLTDTSVQTLPTQALADYFVQTRDRVFGSDRAFVETIVFDPGFECVPESGQSYAQLLRSVATSDADVFPICESYAPALARIDDFAGSLLRTQYPLTLGPLEHIAAVVVTDLDGTRRTLGENDYTWDPDAGLLTLNEGVLSSSDRDLEIQLELDCGVAR
jgi:hypothetical protein